MQIKIEKKKIALNNKQKRLAVTRVLQCEFTAYFKILKVKSESSKKNIEMIYVRLCVLMNFKNNTFKDVNNAHKSK